MRDFQRGLLQEGLRVEAFPFTKIMDVDHAHDIDQANAFTASEPRRVLCVRRAASLAGRHQSDCALLHAVAEALRERGFRVSCVDEDRLTLADRAPLVVSMARSADACRLLSGWQSRGSRVVDDPAAVSQLSRRSVAMACTELGIPYVSTFDTPATAFFPCWVKRADTISALCQGDVRRVTSSQALESALSDLRQRGVDDVEISRHTEGTVIKFYGICDDVAGVDFFRCEAPSAVASSLHEYGRRLGAALHLVIYGGDAVVTPDGAVHLIDFNDFPSFSACRIEAAQTIVQLIES